MPGARRDRERVAPRRERARRDRLQRADVERVRVRRARIGVVRQAGHEQLHLRLPGRRVLDDEVIRAGRGRVRVENLDVGR